MAIECKLEDRVEIKTSAQELHDVCIGKPHLVANMSPDKIHGCTTVQSGDFGSTGTIIEWNYTHEGEKKSTKVIIEVDDGKYKVVYRMIEGHFSEEYNNFHIIYEATPKLPDEDGGTIVQWTLEYEKPDETTPEPTSLLEFLLETTKEVDAHIQEATATETETETETEPAGTATATATATATSTATTTATATAPTTATATATSSATTTATATATATANGRKK